MAVDQVRSSSNIMYELISFPTALFCPCAVCLSFANVWFVTRSPR